MWAVTRGTLAVGDRGMLHGMPGSRIFMAHQAECRSFERQHCRGVATVRVMTTDTAVFDNRMHPCHIGSRVTVALEAERVPFGAQHLRRVAEMRIVTGGATVIECRVNVRLPCSGVVVALQAQPGGLFAEHGAGITGVRSVAAGAAVFKDRVTVLAASLVIVTHVAEIVPLGRKHLRRVAEMRIMTGGTTVIECRMHMRLVRCGIIVALQAQPREFFTEHRAGIPGMRPMAAGAAVLEDRVTVLAPLLVVVAHVAEAVAFLQQYLVVIALMRAVAGGAAILERRVDMGLSAGHVIVTHGTELIAPALGEAERPSLAGVLFPRRFVTALAIAVIGDRAVHHLGLPHYRVTRRSDALRHDRYRGNHHTDYRKKTE